MSASAPRTLADQLRGWSAEQLAELLECRPDLASPAPQDSAQLASRAATRPSVLRTLDRLSVLELAVLDAVVHLAPTDRGAVRAAVHASSASVDAGLDRLTTLALLWGADDRLRPLTIVTELLGTPPGADAAEVPALLDEVDPQARAILDHLETTGADGTLDTRRTNVSVADARSPAEELLARRLLVARDARHVVLPWTVRLALRGGRSTREPVDVVPEIVTSERDPALVDHTAAGAAFEAVRRTELILDHWGTTPPGALRAGGLAVRDLKAAAATMHTDADVAALLIETAAAAGLLAIGATDDGDPAWLPTDGFDLWQGRTVAQRWSVLALAWLGNPRLTGSVGGRTSEDKPVNALAPDLERAWVTGNRTDVLRELATTPEGAVLATGTGLPSLLQRLAWLRPRRPAARAQAVEWSVQEAAALGITGLGGMSGFGRALVGPKDPDDPNDPASRVASALTPLLPAEVDHVLLQADLTAIAPGPLTQELASTLALVADVESRGGATVYRFSAGSIRRAFDAGWSAVEVHDFVETSSRTPVPQALDYLIDDVSRRFGTLRAGVAESFLRSDDETTLTELVHNPAASGLRLRRIAPTVVVSDVPLGTLLPRLRELGAAPVVEAADGTVRLIRPDVFRARTPRGRPSFARETTRASARTSAVVSAIRSGDRVLRSQPAEVSATTPADVMALLRSSIEEGSPVLIGYVDNHGSAAERIVEPVRVETGWLTARDDRADDIRTFAIHRITRASPV